jgi:phage tail sheath protein FI
LYKRQAPAFSGRGDRSTMTQQDLDQGRLIAQIELSPVQAIERITVALVLGERGSATVEDAA